MELAVGSTVYKRLTFFAEPCAQNFYFNGSNRTVSMNILSVPVFIHSFNIINSEKRTGQQKKTSADC